MRKPLFARAGLGARVGSVVTAVALGSCLVAAPAMADDSAVEVTLPELLQSGLHTDYTADAAEGQLSTLDTGTTYPSAFDLRHYGGTISTTTDKYGTKSVITGGTNYVTPVKFQNPFGSCWAFSITAASETSLLTSLDKVDSEDGESLDGSVSYTTASAWVKLDEADDGILNGSIDYGSVSTNTALLAENSSDLSERHLAYFAFSTNNNGMFPSQAGEGKYMVSGKTDGATVMNTGGMPFMGISVYAAGIGPVPESVAPYISDENTVQALYITDDGKDVDYKLFTSTISSLDAYTKAANWAYGNEELGIEAYWTTERKTQALAILAEQGNTLTAAQFERAIKPAISDQGTWSVDSQYTYGVVAELDNSNIVATTRITDETSKNYNALTTESINQIKQELTEGHPLSIGYVSDQSRPGQALKAGSTYINTETWAQYTYEVKQINHAVTIVGWDDSYSASNFTHDIYTYDENGEMVKDEAATALTTPTGDGAWIVKNSWGSQDNDNPLAQNDWGIDNSGYFYLSYYDKNISNVESYEFNVTEEAQERDSYISGQYDLAEAASTSSKSYSSLVRTVNVFTYENEEGAEDYVERIRDLGCLTGAPNDIVNIQLYVMDADADVTATIDEGKPTVTAFQLFENAGFHRFSLDTPVVLNAGQKIAVVQTTMRSDNTYERTVQYGINQTFADAFNACFANLGVVPISSYTKTVVNAGESYIYKDDKWTDWTEGLKEVDAEATAQTMLDVQKQAASINATALKYGQLATIMQSTAAAYQEKADAAEAGSAEQKELQAKADEALAQYKQYKALADAYETSATQLYAMKVDSSIDVDNWTIKTYSDLAVKGDVTGNDKLNIVDAQAAYDLARGCYGDIYKSDTSKYYTMYAMADVTGDGDVAAEDAFAIQYAVMHGWTK